MNIVLIGIQGSGKGTLVAGLEKQLQFELISTGQLFREEIATGSVLGKIIEQCIADGQLVENDLVMQVIENRLKNITKEHVVFDGFPRECGQAKELKKYLNVDLVVNLQLSKENAVERLLDRLTCESCKYITSKKAVTSNICPKCGGKLVVRTDDTMDSINKRFAIYEHETLPLLDLYRSWGVSVVNIDASKTPKQILEDVMRVIK